MAAICTANVKEHDYWGMVRSSAAITQQICAVLVFFVRSVTLSLTHARFVCVCINIFLYVCYFCMLLFLCTYSFA